MEVFHQASIIVRSVDGGHRDALSAAHANLQPVQVRQTVSEDSAKQIDTCNETCCCLSSLAVKATGRAVEERTQPRKAPGGMIS